MEVYLRWLVAIGHEHKLFSPSKVNIPKFAQQLVLVGKVSCL